MARQAPKYRIGIVSVTSGIGMYLAQRFLDEGSNVVGTVRATSNIDVPEGTLVYHLDLSSPTTISRDLEGFVQGVSDFDILVFANGTMEPIGEALNLSPKGLLDNFQVNFFSVIDILAGMRDELGSGDKKKSVFFFSGGGTNSPNIGFAAYTLSKLALLKSSELFASEHPHTQFVCLGPGWVKTKIHTQAIMSSHTPTELKDEYFRRVAENDFLKPSEIYEAIIFMHESFPNFSGRNVSLVNDNYKSREYIDRLLQDADYLKLRRSGNAFANGITHEDF